MIRASTVLNVSDNSGVIKVRCIHVNGSTGLFSAKVGDIIVVSTIVVSPSCSYKKGDVHYAVVLRTKYPIKRKDGSYISFSDNSVAMLDKKSMEPVATAFFGSIPREIRSNKLFGKIISYSKDVL